MSTQEDQNNMRYAVAGNVPRRRDAEATMAQIVEVARTLFGARGYAAVSTREIAEQAGVNAALIPRYFGSKLGLFTAAVPPTLTLGSLFDGPRDEVGAKVAAVLMGRGKAGYDPVLALLQSAADGDTSPLLRVALQVQVIEPLAEFLGGADATARAELLACQIAGFSLWVHVLGGLEVGAKSRQGLETRLARLIQNLVDGGP